MLMPVRNAGKYLDDALQSLADQNFRDFEIIAVDNGSTDGTWDILTAWSTKEPRLRAIRLARPQLARSLNWAASLAQAPLLARLDGDDVAYPSRLALQVAAMWARPQVGLLGSAADTIDAAGSLLGVMRPPVDDESIRQRHRTSCGMVASTTIMRAELFHRAGGYREGLNLSEDYDLFTRLSELGEIQALADVLVGYRIHHNSVTARQPLRMALASLCVSAAVTARRQGKAEPFASGRPSLRRALSILGMSRKAARRQLRWRSAATLLVRKLVSWPVPPTVRALAAQLLRRSGIRQLYTWWLRASMKSSIVCLGPCDPGGHEHGSGIAGLVPAASIAR